MPSELFYRINFTISITAPILGIMFNLLIIFIIIKNQKCHTVTNLLMCDLCTASSIYLVLHLIGCYYGLRADWSTYQPLCVLRAYFIFVAIAATTYSFVIRAISQLFFVVFYTHKFSLTWRTHWILILLKWLGSFLLAIQPIFIERGFEHVQEHRMCGIKTNKLSVAPYSVIVVHAFPASVVVIVYGAILYQVRQSAHRVRSMVVRNSNAVCVTLASAQKSLKIMQNMLIMMNILMFGGAPYLILMLWDLIKRGTAPKELYFLSVNSLVLANTVMAIILFYKNKPVKTIALECFHRNREHN